MKLIDVVVGKYERVVQILIDKIASLLYFLLGYGKGDEAGMVELRFIAYHSLVAMTLNVLENARYCGVQLRNIQVRTLHDRCPLGLFRIPYNIHAVLF